MEVLASASRDRIKIAQDVGGVVRRLREEVRRLTNVQREFAVCMTEGRESCDICFKSAGGNGDGGGVGLIRECK